MSIQANVNKMLSLGALLASQNPTLKAQAEAREKGAQLEREAAGIQKQIDIAKPHGKAGKPTTSQAKVDLADIRRKQFELNPTEQSFQEFRSAEKESAKAQRYLENAQKQRRIGKSFVDLIKAEETNLGAVSDLGQSAIDQIISAYSPSERKQFMAERSNK